MDYTVASGKEMYLCVFFTPQCPGACIHEVLDKDQVFCLKILLAGDLARERVIGVFEAAWW